MAVGFTVDFYYYSIGSADFLHSFFSTVAVNLENISEDITDLSNYFVTSEGEDFISVLFTALNDSKQMKAPVEIVSL